MIRSILPLFVVALALSPALASAQLPAPRTDTAVAQLADTVVGVAFWPGHATWGQPNRSASRCVATTPTYHLGPAGSDGAGLVAKAWQLPGPVDLLTDSHPYGPLQFWLPHALWSPVERADWQLGDAIVHPSATPGSVQLLDATDDWGQVLAWRCQSCSGGCDHAIAPMGPEWQGRRRHNLLKTSSWGQVTGQLLSRKSDLLAGNLPEPEPEPGPGPGPGPQPEPGPEPEPEPEPQPELDPESDEFLSDSGCSSSRRGPVGGTGALVATAYGGLYLLGRRRKIGLHSLSGVHHGPAVRSRQSPPSQESC